jgi:hypothetical protein
MELGECIGDVRENTVAKKGLKESEITLGLWADWGFSIEMENGMCRLKLCSFMRPQVLKILFVCTCLEPGMDGVGDYTRRLASELSSRGHLCYVLALADPRVAAITRDDDSIRLPAALSWGDRIREAQHFRDEIVPDWISWQFVPYGYDPRGICLGLDRRLEEIAEGFPNHIMFHETWIGEAGHYSLKHKLLGKWQKMVFRGLLRRLKPRVVHTHTPLYQCWLGRLNCPALLLPLFGNIPLSPHPRPEWLTEKWLGFDLTARANWWIFLIFGSIHPEWDADDFLDRTSAAARQAGKKCAFISIGRQGPAGEQKWRSLEERGENVWTLLNLGPLPEEDISQALFAADFGVSAVPPEYLFKSGTAAAMIEHGLEFIVTRPVGDYPDVPPEILARRLQNVLTDFDLAGRGKTKVGSLLPEVADRFLADLHAATASVSTP